MNWNGQRQYLDHAIKIRTEPQNAVKLQQELDAGRRKRVKESTCTRPVFLPLQFNMNAAGQIGAYRDITDHLAYDVIITGMKTDKQTRDIIIKYTENEQQLVRIGDNQNLFLRSDNLAGLTTDTGGGQLGVFYLPCPIILKAANRITIEMFKTDTTAAIEQANIVLIGVRVYRQDYTSEILDPLEKALIDKFISLREVPQVRVLKVGFDFPTALAAAEKTNLNTPRVEEPLLVLGMRTTLRRSQIEIGIQGEPSWTVKPTPIWSVACEDEAVHENYLWFSKPVYLHSEEVINIRRVINSIDGLTLDNQTGNQITFICKTV